MIIAYRTARNAQYFMYIHTHPTEAVDTTVIHTHTQQRAADTTGAFLLLF